MTATDIDPRGDLHLMAGAATLAGEIALGFFKSVNRSWMKLGNSPVSDADIAVNAHLESVLRAARPDYGWLSEETEDDASRHAGGLTFICDPIDGTRGFLEGNPQWCISLALVQAGRPVSAVLNCPALGRMFTAQAGAGAWLNGEPIITPAQTSVHRVTASKRLNQILGEEFGSNLEIAPFVPSLAYRLALVATGELDAAFARSGSHDWDLAAADLILGETGGGIADQSGHSLKYDQSSSRKPALLAWGSGRREAAFALAKQGGFLQ